MIVVMGFWILDFRFWIGDPGAPHTQVQARDAFALCIARLLKNSGSCHSERSEESRSGFGRKEAADQIPQLLGDDLTRTCARNGKMRPKKTYIKVYIVGGQMRRLVHHRDRRVGI